MFFFPSFSSGSREPTCLFSWSFQKENNLLSWDKLVLSAFSSFLGLSLCLNSIYSSLTSGRDSVLDEDLAGGLSRGAWMALVTEASPWSSGAPLCQQLSFTPAAWVPQGLSAAQGPQLLPCCPLSLPHICWQHVCLVPTEGLSPPSQSGQWGHWGTLSFGLTISIHLLFLRTSSYEGG